MHLASLKLLQLTLKPRSNFDPILNEVGRLHYGAPLSAPSCPSAFSRSTSLPTRSSGNHFRAFRHDCRAFARQAEAEIDGARAFRASISLRTMHLPKDYARHFTTIDNTHRLQARR